MTDRIQKSVLLILCLLFLFSALCLAEETPLSQEDFAITLDGVSFQVGCPAAALIAKAEGFWCLKMAKTESESCMFTGMDKEYACDPMIIGTHPSGKKGEDEVESLLIFDTGLATARGITVGMNRAQVVAAYGENGFEDWDELSFTDPGTGASVVFVFDLENDEVICWMILRNTDAA